MAKKQQTSPGESERKPPAHEIKVGRIRCTLWLNEGEEGKWYSMTFHRTYKQGNEFKSATTYGRDDLLVVAEIARLAWMWIASQTGASGVGDIPMPGGASQSTGIEDEIPI